jgi:hypothetical protein
MLDQQTQGLNSLAQVPERNAQLAAQQQANTDAAYASPARDANPYEQSLARQIMRSVPGHNPEFEDRLHGELQGGGLGAPTAPQSQNQGLAPVEGPQATAVNIGPQTQFVPDWTSSRGQDTKPGMPELTVTRQPMSMNGEPMRQPLPAARAFAMQRNPPPGPMNQPTPALDPTQNQGPKTRGDVDLTMRMAPFMKEWSKPGPKVDHEPDKLTEKKREFDAMMEYRNKALGARKDIAAMAARVRMATSDTDRKALLELMKIKVQEMAVHARIVGQTASGLTGVINDEASRQAAADAQKQLEEAQAEVDQVEKELGAAPKGGRGKKTSVDISVKYRYSPDGRTRVKDLGGGKFGPEEQVK